MDPTWNLQLIQLSKFGLKWVQIWKKTKLFGSPNKSNCFCEAGEVLFACGSRIMPSVQIWARLLLCYWVSANMESDSLSAALREQEDNESLNLDLHLGKASPPTSGSSGLSAVFSAATRLHFITLTETKPSSIFHHDDEWNMWHQHCQSSLRLCLTLTYITRFLCI